jgi:hypothetical protein
VELVKCRGQFSLSMPAVIARRANDHNEASLQEIMSQGFKECKDAVLPVHTLDQLYNLCKSVQSVSSVFYSIWKIMIISAICVLFIQANQVDMVVRVLS